MNIVLRVLVNLTERLTFEICSCPSSRIDLSPASCSVHRRGVRTQVWRLLRQPVRKYGLKILINWDRERRCSVPPSQEAERDTFCRNCTLVFSVTNLVGWFPEMGS